jgi:hypothetical protein
MKEISSRLGAEEWGLIDATLKQFGLPWLDTWNGTKTAYVLEMLDEAKDRPLVDLGQHVGYEPDGATTPRVGPRFWRRGMLRVFMTHLARERKVAAELQKAMFMYGMSCFVAHNDIEPTQEWQTQIETALATCDALVALLHDGFHESKWTDQEIGFAMGRGVPVYSIRYGQDPYGFIGRFQAFNSGRKSAGTLAGNLFDAYRKGKQTQQKMGDVLVNLFEESASFAEAKARIGYLEELETWEPSYPARIRAAAKSNSQISGSWGVADRVTILARKWARSRV